MLKRKFSLAKIIWAPMMLGDRFSQRVFNPLTNGVFAFAGDTFDCGCQRARYGNCECDLVHRGCAYSDQAGTSRQKAIKLQNNNPLPGF